VRFRLIEVVYFVCFVAKKLEILEEDRRRIQAGENGMSRENEKIL